MEKNKKKINGKVLIALIIALSLALLFLLYKIIKIDNKINSFSDFYATDIYYHYFEPTNDSLTGTYELIFNLHSKFDNYNNNKDLKLYFNCYDESGKLVVNDLIFILKSKDSSNRDFMKRYDAGYNYDKISYCLLNAVVILK